MVTLAEVKTFLHVNYGEHDDLIQNLINASSDHLASIGVNMESVPLPDAVKQAQLIQVAYWFENRGDDDSLRSFEAMKSSVNRLISPFAEISV